MEALGRLVLAGSRQPPGRTILCTASRGRVSYVQAEYLSRVSCIWADGGNRWQGSGSSWQVGFDSSTISQLLIPASALILGASICITFKYGITVTNLMDEKS